MNSRCLIGIFPRAKDHRSSIAGRQIDATWKAQLNIENIFNKGYWASADGNNNISPGEPRTFRFKVTAKL